MFLNTLFFCLSVASLLNTFSVFGPLKVEWPGKDGKHPRCPPQGNSKINLQIHLQFSCISYWVSAKRTNMETYLRFNHIKLYVSDMKHGFLDSPQFWRSTLFWNFVWHNLLPPGGLFMLFRVFPIIFRLSASVVAYLFAGKKITARITFILLFQFYWI